jgi:hypothetical protein
VPNAALDLSHWSRNRTPRHLKADTSVEIALAFVSERNDHDVEIAANNHFDADGVLAVWSVISPELALAHRTTIIAAAEHGDFDEWPSEPRGIWLETAISSLAGDAGDDAAYARVLPLLDELVPNLSSREDLWGDEYRKLLAAEARVLSGSISVEREGRIAIFMHQAGAPELPGPWASKLAPDGTDRWLFAFGEPRGGFRYRYELPHYAWADTVRRPKITMPRRGPIRGVLGREWIIKGRRGLTGITYTAGAVTQHPRLVARAIAAVDTHTAE